MLTKAIQKRNAFHPVTLHLTFETKEELESLLKYTGATTRENTEEVLNYSTRDDLTLGDACIADKALYDIYVALDGVYTNG